MLATLGRGGNRCWVLVRLEDRPFDRAVKVHGTCAGQAQHIGSARQASEWLFYQWPAEEDTDKGVAGRAWTCFEALQGKFDPVAARKAFSEAAEEAGILIGDARISPKNLKRRRSFVRNRPLFRPLVSNPFVP
ncbi:DUF982 domain-containing protein [Mesorhizobium sp. AaZ16]|uniref:DUF982 domain-containing protein n=1 Tax=Mesorhizobium sp. AaZ16 TaxID=3402289 RepID=UPI00374F616C